MATTPRNKKRNTNTQRPSNPPVDSPATDAPAPAAEATSTPVPEQPTDTVTVTTQEEVVTPPEQFNDQPVVETNDVPPEPAPVVAPIVIVPPEPQPPQPERPVPPTRGEQVRREMAEAARRRRDAQSNILKGGPVAPPAKASLASLQKWEIVDVTMNDYLQHMGNNSSVDVKTGAAKQRALFMLIKSLLLKSSGKEGQNAMFYLLTIIHEYSASHFTPLLWGRFISQMSGSEAEKQFFRIIMAAMVGLADPKSRGIYARGLDISQIIVYASEIESLRNNVTFLQNLRAFLMSCTRS